MRKLPLILLCALILGLSVRSASAGELGTATLVGQLNLPGDGNNTDVWGWVHPITAREYALVGDGDALMGFQIVDVTDPTDPIFVRRVQGIHGFDVKTRYQHVYTVSGFRGTGGSVVDLTDINNPIINFNAFESSHNLSVDQRGWLFLSDAGSQSELRVYDVRNSATNPAWAWEDNALGAHDTSIKGTWLYDFHGLSFTRIYDITNPGAPVLRGQIVDNDIVYHHSGYPTEDYQYLFICDELSRSPTPDITVWDISNLLSPVKVAEISDPVATVHNLYIIGDYAYVSYYRAGFRVYDVSDPTNPQLADEYDTHIGDELEGKFDGAFGVYPFTNSGAILISDKQSGLFVFNFDTTTPVAISSFVAAYLDGVVRLDWAIGSADDLRGFHIYRANERDGRYVRLNEALLPANGGFRFDDYEVEPGRTYFYRMGAVDRDGEVLSQVRTLTVPIRAIRMEQNYPNPFNPATTIEYEVSATGDVSIVVFDLRGRVIRELVGTVKTPGIHKTVWDGRDNAGERVASGVYFYRMRANGESLTRRLALIK